LLTKISSFANTPCCKFEFASTNSSTQKSCWGPSATVPHESLIPIREVSVSDPSSIEHLENTLSWSANTLSWSACGAGTPPEVQTWRRRLGPPATHGSPPGVVVPSMFYPSGSSNGSVPRMVFGGCAFPPVSLGPAGDCPCRDQAKGVLVTLTGYPRNGAPPGTGLKLCHQGYQKSKRNLVYKIWSQ